MSAKYEKACHECGRVGQGHMASVWRGGETRYFCHNDERSCYNDRRGRYFGEVPVPDAEITYYGVNLDGTLTPDPIDIHEVKE